MSIADQLNKMIPELEEAYTAIEEMGGTLPEQKNYKNLRVAIESIPSGAPNAYVFIYDPNKPEEVDYTDDADDIINIMKGTGYLPNNGYTHIKFTKRCQELNITSIGANVTLCPNIEVVEGLDNFTKVTSIGLRFLAGPSQLSPNTTLREVTSFPPNVRTINGDFLAHNAKLDCPINLPESVTYIGGGFIYNLAIFNSPVTLPPKLTYLGDASFDLCPLFNQPVIMPDTITTAEGFLNRLDSFNSPVHISTGLTSLGASVSMQRLYAFDQPLTIPDSITRLPYAFLQSCWNFTGPLNVGNSAPEIPMPETVLTCRTTDRAYTVGVTITGAQADYWMSKLPNFNDEPASNGGRRLIRGSLTIPEPV